MLCLICGNEFTPRTVTQKYCSAKCRQEAHIKGKTAWMTIEFVCAECGKTVVTEGRKANGRPDMRTKFCCHSCEKKYWRHHYKQDREQADRNINFRSVRAYISYERRTNEA